MSRNGRAMVQMYCSRHSTRRVYTAAGTVCDEKKQKDERRKVTQKDGTFLEEEEGRRRRKKKKEVTRPELATTLLTMTRKNRAVKNAGHHP
jgi:hypothetical protein